MPDGVIWERQVSESAKAFDAFAAYRDMGQHRSTRQVARSLNKSHTLIGRWSSHHDWPRRAAAWDREQDRHRQATQLDEIEEMTRRHSKVVEAQLGAMMLPALELSRRLERDRNYLSQLDAKALVDLVCRAARPVAQLVQTERLVRGLGDAGSETEAEEQAFRRELERMSDEELDAALAGLPDGVPASNGQTATQLPRART
jgi:hypothetical protein